MDNITITAEPEKFKYGFLTPYGILPTGKNFEKDLINVDRFLSHFSTNANFICSMFDYDGLPESVDERFIEMYLSSNGSIAWTKVDDELVVIRGGRSGSPGNYGLGDIYIGTNDNSKTGTLTRTIGEDCVIGYNTSNMAPDFDCWFYADLLKEIEKSIKFNVRYARLAPILKANTSMKEEALRELLNNIDDGNMVNIITSNIVDDLLNDSSNQYEAINLTNVEDIKNIQYLIKSYEDILRIFHTKYGQAEQGSGKLAQQSVDEVNGSASASFVLALNKLKERQKMVNDVNAMFNTSISVKFSPAWDMEYQRYINRVEADVTLEGPEDASEDASELSSEDASENSSEGSDKE